MDENETGYSSVWRKRLYAKERRHKNGLDYFPPYDWLGGWMVSMPPSVGWEDIDYVVVGEFYGICAPWTDGVFGPSFSGKAVRGGEVVAFGTVQWRPNEEAP